MILASFNYYPPPDQYLIWGLVLTILLVSLLALSRRILLTFIGGALVAGLICWNVLGMGKRGDMQGVVQLFYSPLFGLVSGIVGGVMAWLLKLFWKRVLRKGDKDSYTHQDRKADGALSSENQSAAPMRE